MDKGDENFGDITARIAVDNAVQNGIFKDHTVIIVCIDGNKDAFDVANFAFVNSSESDIETAEDVVNLMPMVARAIKIKYGKETKT